MAWSGAGGAQVRRRPVAAESRALAHCETLSPAIPSRFDLVHVRKLLTAQSHLDDLLKLLQGQIGLIGECVSDSRGERLVAQEQETAL